MSYEVPSGVLADMYGPSPYYQALLPLIQELVSPAELQERQRTWQFDTAKHTLARELLDRVQLLKAHAENLKQQCSAAQREARTFLEDAKRWEAACAEQHQLFCEVYAENKVMQDQLEKMEAEIAMCRKHPIIVEKSYDQDVILPQTVWMTEWRAKPGFEKQAMFVRVIGESGLGRLPEIKSWVAQRLGYSSPNAGSLSGAVDTLVERGLLGRRTAEAGMQGRPPKLVWLTNLGQAAYVLLTNKPPIRSELATQSSHVSDAHMLLNLAAAELLQANGYEILAHGHRHFLDGKRQAVPDLTTRKDEQIVYIEVERSGKKSRRPEKWVNICQLTCGNIYVFCQYPFSQEQIAREVQKALLDNKLSSRLRLTNLADLREGLRGPDGSLWLEEIDIYPGMKTSEPDEIGLYD
jgi:hypothetical protein